MNRIRLSISIHAPLARCDEGRKRKLYAAAYFNPRTSCEVRPGMSGQKDGMSQYFNPRTSCEVRQIQFSTDFHILPFQSTHLLRGATSGTPEPMYQITISIHAPLARCDFVFPDTSAVFVISIHAPLARCDVRFFKVLRMAAAFQSTHLLRGATAKLYKRIHFSLNKTLFRKVLRSSINFKACIYI